MAKAIAIEGTGKSIGEDSVFFIAEIGKNFIDTEEEKTVSEYLEKAKRLVDAAIVAGADAVKFQTHVCEDEVLNINFTSPHFRGSDRYSWVSRNERITPLESFWRPLKAYCDEKGILFFSTPMSKKAAVLLDELSVPLWKVGSGDVQDHILLNYLIGTGKPIVISTGMVSLRELDEVISYIAGKGAPLVVLYCVSQYPCPPEKFNLSTITYLKEKYPNIPIGFSDHSITHDAVRGALSLGAQVVEKHFSFDRSLWGSDHKASLTPAEFREMVDLARTERFTENIHDAFLGEREKELEGAENIHRSFFNKALVAGMDIEEGMIVTEDMVYAMRPFALAGGLPAHHLSRIVGRCVVRRHAKYDPITTDSII